MNPPICECFFLHAEIVGDGITTDEVLQNIFNTFFWKHYLQILDLLTFVLIDVSGFAHPTAGGINHADRVM